MLTVGPGAPTGQPLAGRAANEHGLASLEFLAYARVKDAIITLELPPGSPLLEVQVGERLGISKTPLRAALIQLERDGFVLSVPYKGSRVAPITLLQMGHLFELREAIETHAIRAAVERFTEADFAALEAILGQQVAALEQREYTRSYLLSEQFHQYLVDQRENPHFSALFRNTSDHRLRLRHALAQAGRPPRTRASLIHPKKLAALRARDAAEAERITLESSRARLREVEQYERAGRLSPEPSPASS
jgi:DNA-binding GntR family transcriptional regulator